MYIIVHRSLPQYSVSDCPAAVSFKKHFKKFCTSSSLVSISQGSIQCRHPVQGCWDQSGVCCQDHPLQGRAETDGTEGIPTSEEASSPPPCAATHCLHYFPLHGVGGGVLSWKGAAVQSGCKVSGLYLFLRIGLLTNIAIFKESHLFYAQYLQSLGLMHVGFLFSFCLSS